MLTQHNVQQVSVASIVRHPLILILNVLLALVFYRLIVMVMWKKEQILKTAIGLMLVMNIDLVLLFQFLCEMSLKRLRIG